MSTAPWDQPRNASTVTVDVPSPMEASDAELLAVLGRRFPNRPPLDEPRVEYVNHRRQNFDKPGGRVCFCVSWRNPSFVPKESL